MEQWLPRGTTVKAEKRIKKMISSGKDWQIYSTNQDTYVLVATTPLYEKWGADYLLPKGIFDQLSDMNDLWIYCSSGHYIVSSLEQGPYPENNGQIEAFSIAFNTTLRLYPQADLHDAVYIEEYSLILPGDEKPSPSQNDNVYGKWLTGGVNISANSFKRVSQLMSWLSREQLRRSFELAGFEAAYVMIKFTNGALIMLQNIPIISLIRDITPEAKTSLYLMDVEKFLNALPEEPLFDLVVTSPPYNIGKEYENQMPLDEYVIWQKRILEKIYLRLKPSGSICWQVGNYVDNGSIVPLDFEFAPIFKQLGMQLRNRIVWRFGHGLHSKKRFSGRYEVVLWYTKTDDYATPRPL